MIYVLATIQVNPGQREALLDEFRRIIPLVREEDGNVEYTSTVDVETNLAASPESAEDTVVVVERWSSIEALERHLIAPHMVEYRTKVKNLVANVKLQILQPV